MRVAEIYGSVQGEGPLVGHKTVFLRFGGCNLRCSGWPCDTQFAIQPKYRNDWKRMTPEEVIEAVKAEADKSKAFNVTLTGGEPFLQPNEELYTVVNGLNEAGFSLDCFSNGTILYPNWAPDYLLFIMDWKLPGSEEDTWNRVRFFNLGQLHKSGKIHAVKFVIADKDDYRWAKEIWHTHLKHLDKIRIYYGRVWDSDILDRQLVEWIMVDGLPWILNRQEHNYIWPVHERGR